MEKNDEKTTGGPAFPHCVWVGDHHQGHVPGMTLRDYFAGQILTVLLSNFTETLNVRCEVVWWLADEMIRTRGEPPKKGSFQKPETD